MARLKPTAAIVGGSLTGLVAARLLTLRGWDVHVFERVAEELAGRGAGIGTHPELFDVLRAAELPIGPDIGLEVAIRRVLDRDGRVTHEHRYPQVLTHWDRLFSLLRPAVETGRYHLGKAMTGFVETGRGVTLAFADGSRVEADLLVGADGIRSTVRSVLFPDIAPRYAGYIAWRGVVPEERFSEAAHSIMFEHFCFGLPPGEQIAGYPIRPVCRGGAETGREYNVIWYRPADEAQLDAILTDASGRRHESNIPPPLIDPRHVRRVKADAEAILAPQFAEAIRSADGLFCQPIYDVEVQRMVRGRVALLGDAAFVARPHVGAGVTKGFSDAMALCRALDRVETVPEALTAYERERLPIGRRILERARRLGAYMQASKRTAAELEAAEVYRSPEAVLRETASLDFLSDPAPVKPRRLSMTDLYETVDFSQCSWPGWVQDELKARTDNACVGQVLTAEDERVRVWHLRLPPGQRVPFHTHVLDYFWTCVSGGRSRSHALVNGRFEIHETNLKPGSTRFEHYSAGTYKTHDLENIGDIELVFVTVEFLDGGAGAWDVPASVRMPAHDGSLAMAS